MSDFETEFDLTLNLPQRELDNVAQQIDDTVGVTEIGLTDGGSMSAQTAGGGGGRARRRARSRSGWNAHAPTCSRRVSRIWRI